MSAVAQGTLRAQQLPGIAVCRWQALLLCSCFTSQFPVGAFSHTFPSCSAGCSQPSPTLLVLCCHSQLILVSSPSGSTLLLSENMLLMDHVGSEPESLMEACSREKGQAESQVLGRRKSTQRENVRTKTSELDDMCNPFVHFNQSPEIVSCYCEGITKNYTWCLYIIHAPSSLVLQHTSEQGKEQTPQLR